MKDEPDFLTIERVLRIHQRMIDDFGGSALIRDRGLLESAYSMPAASFGGQFLHEDLASMAAAYLFHVCQNHPFIDGNKRTALAAAEAFLDLNGLVIEASDQEAEDLTRAVAEGRIAKERVIEFFQAFVVPLR